MSNEQAPEAGGVRQIIQSLPVHTNRVHAMQKTKRLRKVVSDRAAAAIEAGNIQDVIDSLTGKQKAFCEEYLKDLNATQAVLRAGYQTNNAKQIAGQLMENPAIRIAIDALRAERNKSSDVTKDYVLRNLQKGMRMAEEAGNVNAYLRANELIARHLGMFIERTEVSGPDGNAIEMKQIAEDVDAFTVALQSLAKRNGGKQ